MDPEYPRGVMTSSMRHVTALLVAAGLCGASTSGQVVDTISGPIQQAQYDLSMDGRAFLLTEAARASFFMLGELHGDNQIPALIRSIWPTMWEAGYRNVAAEVSPWAASRLEFGSPGVPIIGLWTQSQATFVTSLKKDSAAVLWGCDIEEAQPHLLIRELAAANPENKDLQAAVNMVKSGYQRQLAQALLERVRAATGIKDVPIGASSLQGSVVHTLEVEAARSAGLTLQASTRREAVMKELFRARWVKARTRVFLRFGRNHLHRGLDRRGVSTLGNFVSELAAAEGLVAFNVAAFSGGGKIRAPGLIEFDERMNDPAFGYLASVARYPATVFDLRPLRQPLHRLPESKRSAIEASLLYWADSYDAIIFYREVTPVEFI
jgi:hypothetical protein